MPDLKEMLQQDGYLDVAKLIETLENSISRKAEYLYLRAFARESCFDEDICRDQLRMLWTVYCLHHGLMVDTAEYDNNLLEMWNEIGDGTSEWDGYNSFDAFMCKYLV